MSRHVCGRCPRAGRARANAPSALRCGPGYEMLCAAAALDCIPVAPASGPSLYRLANMRRVMSSTGARSSVKTGAPAAGTNSTRVSAARRARSPTPGVLPAAWN